MILSEGDLEFNFTDGTNVFKFDEVNNASPNYHGLTHCMKSVDFIIECQDDWLFVEIKDFEHPSRSFAGTPDIDDLVAKLVQKYRDTFLYRWAEKKLDKPIRYICLVALSSPSVYLTDKLKRQLPVPKKQSERWSQSIVLSVSVMNIEEWNRHFSEWPVIRVSDLLKSS